MPLATPGSALSGRFTRPSDPSAVSKVLLASGVVAWRVGGLYFAAEEHARLVSERRRIRAERLRLAYAALEARALTVLEQDALERGCLPL